MDREVRAEPKECNVPEAEKDLLLGDRLRWGEENTLWVGQHRHPWRAWQSITTGMQEPETYWSELRTWNGGKGVERTPSV